MAHQEFSENDSDITVAIVDDSCLSGHDAKEVIVSNLERWQRAIRGCWVLANYSQRAYIIPLKCFLQLPLKGGCRLTCGYQDFVVTLHK